MRNKYNKVTQGQNAQVFVAKPSVAYTTDATYDLFVANAAEGEIGVFLTYDASGPTTYDESVAALNSADAALQAGDRFFIAQKRDSGIHRTPVYRYGDMVVRQKAYVAPVKQVTNIGYTGTSGSLNSGTLIVGQIFPIKFVETTPGNQPYPTWDYEETSRSGDTLESIGSRLLNQINNTLSAQNQYNGRLVRVEMLVADGSFSASSGGAFTVVQDSKIITTVESSGAAADAGKYAADASSMAVGDYIRIGGTGDTSPVYRIAAVAGIGTAAATITLESPYTGTSGSVAAANVGVVTTITEIGFKATAIDNGVHFRVALDEDLISASLAYTTPYKEGNGTYQQVADLEEAGEVFAGRTTLNAAFEEDFGKPTSFADSASTYSLIFLDYVKTEASVAAPKTQDSHYGHVIIAGIVGASPFTDIDGIFVTL